MIGPFRTVLVRPWVILTAGGVAALALLWHASTALQLAYLTVLVTCLLALGIGVWLRATTLSKHGELLSVPLILAQDQQILDLYRSVSASLRDVSANLDPIYHELAVDRIRQVGQELAQVARGQVVFQETETWRMAYDRLLRSRGLYLYRSVAYVKTANYWQDEPGRQSMQANFTAREAGLNIQRIAIIPDHLWAATEQFPIEPILTWIDEQHQHGIIVKLVRQSALRSEPDLVEDMGLYGNRAAGFQTLDDQGRTTRFTLSFDFAEVLAAEQRWERLSLYATAFRDLLVGTTQRT